MSTPASNSVRRMTGGHALAEMLQLSGVGPMFGMGGFQLLPFYEACRALGLKHFLINDERCGAFAADAYAKVTNRPGVADGTLGPGATNLVTGLIESLNAGIPMIVITGDANREHAWKNMTQEARQLDVLRPAVKEVIRVEVTKRVPEHVRRAFAVATSGRPGPVLIDVPEDIAHGEHDFDAGDFWVDPGTLKAQARRTRPDPAELARAAALIAKAERPLVLAGGGVHISEAHAALQGLAEAYGIPVAHTMSGKGAIACTHALSAGLFGRYDRIANALIAASDCLIVVGCKLGEIATKRFALIPPGKPIIDDDPVPADRAGGRRPATWAARRRSSAASWRCAPRRLDSDVLVRCWCPASSSPLPAWSSTSSASWWSTGCFPRRSPAPWSCSSASTSHRWRRRPTGSRTSGWRWRPWRSSSSPRCCWRGFLARISIPLGLVFGYLLRPARRAAGRSPRRCRGRTCATPPGEAGAQGPHRVATVFPHDRIGFDAVGDRALVRPAAVHRPLVLGELLAARAAGGDRPTSRTTPDT